MKPTPLVPVTTVNTKWEKTWSGSAYLNLGAVQLGVVSQQPRGWYWVSYVTNNSGYTTSRVSAMDRVVKELEKA